MEIKNIHNIISAYYYKYAYLIKTFITICILFFICYLSIFRSNYDYYGNFNIIYDNIHLENFTNNSLEKYSFSNIIISNFLKLLYTFSLSQFFSVLLISLSSTILIYTFSSTQKISFFKIASSLIIGLTPSFLDLFCNKYYSTVYAFSIFASIFPIIFYTKNVYKYIIIATISNFVSLLSCYYMSGIYPVITFFICFHLYINGSSLIKIRNFFISSFISYFLSLTLFIIIKLKSFILIGEILEKTFFDINLLDIYKKFYSNLLFDLCPRWRLIIFAIIFLFMINIIIKTKRNEIITFLLSLLLLSLINVIQYGIVPHVINFKQISNIYPIYYYGYSIPLTIIMLICIDLDKKIMLSKLITFYLVFILGMFSLSYGNLLYEQKRFDEFKLNSIIQDLKEIDFIKNWYLEKIIITNDGGHTPILEKKGMEYKVLFKIVHPLNVKGYIAEIEKQLGKNKSIPKKIVSESKEYSTESLKLHKNTTFYKIETNYTDTVKIDLYKNDLWDNY